MNAPPFAQGFLKADDRHGGEDMEPESAHANSPTTVFDRSALGSRLMDDPDLIAEIVSIFLADIPCRIGVLKEHVASGRTTAAGEQAHAIKGAAADVGGETLRSVAFQMEKSGKADDLGSLERLMPELEREFERLREAMTK
jgi:HPt (histidine-containing phosphotransfer) domain-containing protein